MAVPHGPQGVRVARRRMREELRACGAPDTVVDDAILILSELLSNACRHARPLHEEATAGTNGTGSPVDTVRASWRRDVRGEVTIAVTDGGGPTRPLPAKPSVTARGGRGLAIITALARDWGVRSEPDTPADEPPGVTVWAVLRPDSSFSGRVAASLDGLEDGLHGDLDGSLDGEFDLASVEELK
ncbi:ATP-binding protein [Streptomyces sp. CA-250714]|uniref:ATP-binding protein n=1 Tax=Streptomyces sp. CA-250714 TaxID=3240060 RepID=UPI003D91A29E